MLIIRLQRTGRENLPTYRIVVAEKARPVKGKFLEILGHYLPARDPAVLEVTKERVEYWMQRGAAVSDTAARLLSKQGIENMEKYIQKYTKQKRKKEEEEAPAPAPAATPAAEKSAPAPEAAKPAEAPAPEAEKKSPDAEPSPAPEAPTAAPVPTEPDSATPAA
ncbi:30S ribosomal protein S16 [Candidatus Peregrinibacteria bacterium CG1_02_54_53]|nr:MAG: 30S ribosomal protein S16 [Candidatus Peregrinibacteria bacterium CG1_02_54_53]